MIIIKTNKKSDKMGKVIKKWQRKHEIKRIRT